MPETTPLIKAALNLRVGAGFDVYEITILFSFFTLLQPLFHLKPAMYIPSLFILNIFFVNYILYYYTHIVFLVFYKNPLLLLYLSFYTYY